MRRAFVWTASALVLSLFLACPRPSGGQVRADSFEPTRPRFEPKADPVAEQALSQAESGAQSASPTKQVELYLAVRKAYPESIAGQEALYRAADAAYAARDFPKARSLFGELLFENPLFDKANDARFKLGLSALETYAYREALQMLLAVADRSQGEDRARALAAAARAAEGFEQFDEALRIAIRVSDEAGTPAEREAALQRITELVEGRVGFLDIAKVRQDLSPGHPAWPVLTFKLARVYHHLRDWTRLEETLQAFLREAPNHAYAPAARELLERSARRAEVKPRTVGVVLPMSGRYKQVGEAVMRGVQLALKGSDIELVVKDSQGDMTLAGRQVEELAFDEGVIAIIGPVLEDESRRAALVAEELQVPLLTLTRGEGITAIGPHIFRNMLTAQQQAEALAEYAVHSLGYKTFAVLYPNIPFGVKMTNEFWDEVLARGGAMRGAESYAFDQKTFTSEAKKLVGRYYLEDRADYIEKSREIIQGTSDQFRRRKALEKLRSSLNPIVDFEALLIPDSWENVGLVAPALAVEDIITNACDPRDLERIRKTTGKKDLKTVTLLGTNTWSSPKNRAGVPGLIERGGKFVMCSVYVDGFFADSSRAPTKKFVNAYRNAYSDYEPTLLDAIGYDSAQIVRTILDKRAPASRAAFTTELSAVRGFDGATGETSFNDAREAVKPLFFLTIDNQGIKELTPKAKPSGS